MKINCIMLIDDNEDDNFFHERTIRSTGICSQVVAMQSARAALDYLKNHDIDSDVHPDLIFLDLNMPGMNGWEFLEEYSKLGERLKSKAVIVMLTSSESVFEQERAGSYHIVSDFKTKPLTKEMLLEIVGENFGGE